VVVAEGRDGQRFGFLVLSDDTHVEIYVRNGGASSRSPGGVDLVLRRCV
jgi:hypothetical protein